MKPDENKRRHIVVCGKSGGSAESVEWDDIQNKPDFAEVATSGDYDDLENKPQLATVATSGSYNDLSNKPTIPAAQVNADWNSASGVAQILNKPNLATVATSGSYNDLSNKPTIPAAQVNSDWNARSGKTQILNKPTVPDETETLTFTMQGGTTVTMDVYVKIDYTKTYFYVQDLSGNGGTLTFQAMDGNVNDFDLYTSTDQQTWTLAGRMEMFAYFQVPIPANGKLYIKATTDKWGGDEWFESDVPYAVGGNLMSILFGDNFENVTALTSVNARCFNFHGDSNLCNASKLVLPATTLTSECYYGMFSGCTSLTSAPAILPATTLAENENCYYEMFSGCTSLTTAPVLPATTLDIYCYCGMFQGCTSLTEAPVLPATRLEGGCYERMFQGCTSLVEAPELPATTMSSYCYMNMFNGCTSLNKMSVYATAGITESNLNNWLNNVSATGDFYNLGGATYPSGASGIPSGWTEHTSL